MLLITSDDTLDICQCQRWLVIHNVLTDEEEVDTLPVCCYQVVSK